MPPSLTASLNFTSFLQTPLHVNINDKYVPNRSFGILIGIPKFTLQEQTFSFQASGCNAKIGFATMSGTKFSLLRTDCHEPNSVPLVHMLKP